MHEELKREFEEKFVWEYKDLFYDSNGEWQSITKSQLNIKSIDEFWLWFESKLPKAVEIKLVEEQTYYRCPNCDIWLSNADGSDEEDDYTDNFCPNCGAKINWK